MEEDDFFLIQAAADVGPDGGRERARRVSGLEDVAFGHEEFDLNAGWRDAARGPAPGDLDDQVQLLPPIDDDDLAHLGRPTETPVRGDEMPEVQLDAMPTDEPQQER